MTRDDELLHLANRTAATLMSEVDGARAALVASSDGFDLARAGALPLEAARLAAMVSSLAELGDAASRECELGQPQCLVVDSSAGRLVVRSVLWRGEPLLVVLLTDTSVMLGMVLNALSGIERTLGHA